VVFRTQGLDGIDFLVFNNEVLAFCNLKPARRVFSGDNFTGLPRIPAKKNADSI
jgi:hypothetical protein